MDLMQAMALVDKLANKAMEKQDRGPELIEAMAFLQDWGIERDMLIWFWKSLGMDHDMGRFQNANGARNRIKLLINERRWAMKEGRKPTQTYWRD